MILKKIKETFQPAYTFVIFLFPLWFPVLLFLALFLFKDPVLNEEDAGDPIGTTGSPLADLVFKYLFISGGLLIQLGGFYFLGFLFFLAFILSYFQRKYIYLKNPLVSFVIFLALLLMINFVK